MISPGFSYLSIAGAALPNAWVATVSDATARRPAIGQNICIGDQAQRAFCLFVLGFGASVAGITGIYLGAGASGWAVLVFCAIISSTIPAAEAYALSPRALDANCGALLGATGIDALTMRRHRGER